MNGQQLTDAIFNTTNSLKAAIDNAAEAVEVLIACKKALALAKQAAFDAGKIDGKNEDIRKAQYAEVCEAEFDEVEMAEKVERRTKTTVELMRLDYDMAMAVLRIHEWNAAG